MNSLREIYDALLAGETLIDERKYCKVSLRKSTGMVVYDWLAPATTFPNFSDPTIWSIYEESKPHVHADLMMQYAKDAATTDTPWKLWEFRANGCSKWFIPDAHPRWDTNHEYRRKSV